MEIGGKWGQILSESLRAFPKRIFPRFLPFQTKQIQTPLLPLYSTQLPPLLSSYALLSFSSMQNHTKALQGFFKNKDMTMASLRQRLEKVEDCSPSPSPSSSEQFHVLAVDDSLVDRKVIERLLKVSAYKVTTVDSGKRALQLLGLDGDNSTVDFNALEVNMIITDYSMPEMTGYDLLKKIKESSTWKKIPVVIMSSENVLTRIDRCLEEGAEEFITKPVKLSDVKRLRSYILKGGEESGGSRKRKSPPSPPPSSREEIRRRITVD